MRVEQDREMMMVLPASAMVTVETDPSELILPLSPFVPQSLSPFFARSSTASSMASVNRPVNVFCWLT